jgi:rubredoxin-NAD+ reductase
MAPIVIIGAGLAAWTTAREIRKLDPAVPVTMVTSDTGHFYAKPSLSNAFAQGRTPAQLVTTPVEKMTETLKVEVLASTAVLAVDPVARHITSTGGQLSYRHLVLATGARPIRVPVSGDAADEILSINSLDDFTAFHARLTGIDAAGRARQVLIMGAGLIGCEFANDLAAAGFKVTVVDPAPGPMAALLPPDAGAQLRDALAALGVAWHFGTTVQAVDHDHGTPGSALAVTLADGTRVPADLVLSAIGLRAETSLARAAGLAYDRGVLVDSYLQTSDPHIHALGDAAQYAGGDWNGSPVTGGRSLPYVMPIMNAAKALAATLTGRRTAVVFPLMPVAIKTPALPIVVAAAPAGVRALWQATEPGIWQQVDPQGQVRGFVLAGKQTGRRAELSRLVMA